MIKVSLALHYILPSLLLVLPSHHRHELSLSINGSRNLPCVAQKRIRPKSSQALQSSAAKTCFRRQPRRVSARWAERNAVRFRSRAALSSRIILLVLNWCQRTRLCYRYRRCYPTRDVVHSEPSRFIRDDNGTNQDAGRMERALPGGRSIVH